MHLRRQLSPKSEIHISLLTCSGIYPSIGSFWPELLSFGGNSCRDVGLLSNIMELDYTLPVVLNVPKK